MDLTAYHYVSLFRENIQKYPKKEALMRKIDAHWQPISWEKLGTNGHLPTLRVCKYAP